MPIKTHPFGGVLILALYGMCNYPCFERVAISSDSEKTEEIRMYFVKITQFLIENQKLIYQAMENKNTF